MTKIFCIGLSKTGTTSLHQALTGLGFKSLHYGGPNAEYMIHRAMVEGKPLLHYFKNYFDAYSDVGILSRQFALADKQYAGSKFILTWRSLDAWMDSRARHNVRFNRPRTSTDREKWKAEWHAHHQKIHDYFQNRPHDFLVMDVCAGQGYELLCPFLNKPLPLQPFPKSNIHRHASTLSADVDKPAV